MARTKGSKNKKTILKQQGADIQAQIAVQEEACAVLTEEIKGLESQAIEIRELIKEKKKEQKVAAKCLEELKNSQAKAEREAQEAAKRIELAETIQMLLDTGLTAGEILNKLK